MIADDRAASNSNDNNGNVSNIVTIIDNRTAAGYNNAQDNDSEAAEWLTTVTETNSNFDPAMHDDILDDDDDDAAPLAPELEAVRRELREVAGEVLGSGRQAARGAAECRPEP